MSKKNMVVAISQRSNFIFMGEEIFYSYEMLGKAEVDGTG